jgi:hypothetical protein
MVCACPGNGKNKIRCACVTPAFPPRKGQVKWFNTVSTPFALSHLLTLSGSDKGKMAQEGGTGPTESGYVNFERSNP